MTRFSLVLLALLWPLNVVAAELRLAVTTSFHNSGLSEVLLPAAMDELGIDVRLLVVGTGQALRLGRAGDVDAILVHSRKAEEAFVAEGHATKRREIMFNDFIILGPSGDPAKVADAHSAADALLRIGAAEASFVSRGDDSGTHRREIELWKQAGPNPSDEGSQWYREVGAGMGAALNTASGMSAYILSDRASWLNFANKGDLRLLYSGDPALFNPYAYLPLSADRHPHVKFELAERFGDWLSGPVGQSLIGAYKVNGETPFTPSAGRADAPIRK